LLPGAVNTNTNVVPQRTASAVDSIAEAPISWYASMRRRSAKPGSTWSTIGFSAVDVWSPSPITRTASTSGSASQPVSCARIAVSLSRTASNAVI
jgi:hypothetical protein